MDERCKAYVGYPPTAYLQLHFRTLKRNHSGSMGEMSMPPDHIGCYLQGLVGQKDEFLTERIVLACETRLPLDEKISSTESYHEVPGYIVA